MNLREQLRSEILETQTRFHQLLDSVPNESFDLPSDNPVWTIGEVLYHMSLAPRFVIVDFRIIAGNRWIYALIPRVVPKALFDWVNARFTRYGARHLSRQYLAREYDGTHEIAIQALDMVADEDFQKSVLNPDWDPMLSGEVTVERLFRYVKCHFEAHAAEIDRLEAGQ